MYNYPTNNQTGWHWWLAHQCRAATRLTILLTLLTLTTQTALAVEHVTIQRNGETTKLSGRITVEALDKSLLFQTADGTLWPIEAKEIVARATDDVPFKPLAADAAAREVLKTLGPGFEVHTTKNYAICYNSNKAYAEWVGSLFEGLHKGFHVFWTAKGIKPTKPEFPLIAIVFADEKSYAAYVEKKYDKNVASLVAFYGLSSNHVTLYDLTGVGALRREGSRRGDAAQINQMLSHKEAAKNVATVVHEAFHQLQFNCGLSQRHADVPLWVAEGLAMYFETPDLSNDKGWKTIGATHYGRLGDMRAYLATRPPRSLDSLIIDDRRFRDPRENLAAYAEAWSLNHFMMQRHAKKYVTYLKTIAAKPPAVIDTPEERLAEFESVFGPPAKLDAEFLKHVKGLR